MTARIYEDSGEDMLCGACGGLITSNQPYFTSWMGEHCHTKAEDCD